MPDDDVPGDIDWNHYFDHSREPVERLGALAAWPKAPSHAGPAMRVLLDPIAPDATGGAQGLRDGYGGLEGELPLGGGAAMGPVDGGGVMLCARLRETMPWMTPAIDAVERQLSIALWAGRPWLQWRPFLLVGPPGAGKTHLAREIGRVAGVGTARLDMGGMHDSAAVSPTARGWSSARPCWPLEMINCFGCANPVLTLDELDKAGGSRANGDAREAVLAMLEPSTASSFFDTCLMARADLGAVCWIATANDVAGLPDVLVSRLDVVHVGAPGVEHFGAVADGILRAIASRWRVPPATMPDLPPRAWSVLRDAFARHHSVRRLRRQVEDVLAALVAGPRSGLH